jgi:hypothetical protein
MPGGRIVKRGRICQLIRVQASTNFVFGPSLPNFRTSFFLNAPYRVTSSRPSHSPTHDYDFSRPALGFLINTEGTLIRLEGGKVSPQYL